MNQDNEQKQPLVFDLGAMKEEIERETIFTSTGGKYHWEDQHAEAEVNAITALTRKLLKAHPKRYGCNHEICRLAHEIGEQHEGKFPLDRRDLGDLSLALDHLEDWAAWERGLTAYNISPLVRHEVNEIVGRHRDERTLLKADWQRLGRRLSGYFPRQVVRERQRRAEEQENKSNE